MIVYKSRRFVVRRYKYEGSGIVSTIGSLLARYATKAMLATSAKTAMRGTLDAAKRAVPHLITHKLDINVKLRQEAQLKNAFVDTGDIDINVLIDGSGIVLE